MKRGAGEAQRCEKGETREAGCRQEGMQSVCIARGVAEEPRRRD